MNTIQYRKAEEPDVPVSPYDPNALFDEIMKRKHLTGDSALADVLGIDADMIRKIREKRVKVSPSMLLLFQENTGITVQEMRRLMNERRWTTGIALHRKDRRR